MTSIASHRPVYSHSRYKAAAALLAAIAVAGMSSTASGAAFTKADNTTSLNLAGSYTANSGVPGQGDTLTVDNTLTASRTSAIGGNVSLLGITMNAAPVAGSSRQLQINATAGSTLTIYGSGITKAANTSALILASAVALGANQTWTLNAATGTGTGNLQLNTTSFNDNGFTLGVTGAGLFDLRPTGTLTLSSNVTVSANVSVNSATAVVVFQGSNTFDNLAIPNGRVQVATIGNFGVASNAGDGGTNVAITVGNTSNGVLEYTGSTAITNRTISRDGRSASSGVEVSTAGQTLTVTGNLGSGTQVNAGTNGWVFGGAGNLSLSGVISNSTGVGSTGTTITKNGTGTLTLSGNNTLSGIVTVSNGTLLVENTVGSGTGSGNVTIQNGATLGGDGIISGSVTFDAGAKFAFSTTKTLDVNGASVSFGGFSIANLVGLDNLVADGTYTLIGGSASISSTSLSNLGSGNSASLGLNKSAYFDLSSGDLQVIVATAAIPEPSSFAILAGLAGLGLAGLRRRRA